MESSWPGLPLFPPWYFHMICDHSCSCVASFFSPVLLLKSHFQLTRCKPLFHAIVSLYPSFSFLAFGLSFFQFSVIPCATEIPAKLITFFPSGPMINLYNSALGFFFQVIPDLVRFVSIKTKHSELSHLFSQSVQVSSLPHVSYASDQGCQT